MALVRILLCILINILKYPDSYGNEIMIDMLNIQMYWIRIQFCMLIDIPNYPYSFDKILH